MELTELRQTVKSLEEKVAALENGAVKANADAITEITKQGGTIDTKVAALENGQVKTNKEAIGTLTNLETTAKSDLVAAINEAFTYADNNASDIGTLQTKVQALESVSYVEITAAEIDAMFEA